MAKWNVYGAVRGTKYLGEVEAETEEEAVEKAWELDGTQINVCHQCVEEIEDGQIDEITACEAAA